MKYYELSSTLVKYPFTNPFNRDALTATEWRQVLSLSGKLQNNKFQSY